MIHKKRKNSNTLVVTGGGTGGHIYPILAIIAELRGSNKDIIPHKQLRIVWVGSRSGLEAQVVPQEGVEFIGIHAGKLRRYFSPKNILDFFLFLLGIIESIIVLTYLKPGLLFSKGGFVSVPPVFAARLRKIPIISHEADLDPGLATKINYSASKIMCIPFEESKKYYKVNVTSQKTQIVVTGNPVRSDIMYADGKKGREILGFSSELPLLLVLGGSLGSRQINGIIRSSLPAVLEHCQVLHQTGDENWKVNLPAHLKTRYLHRVFIYEHYFDILKASDLVCARAGAGILWEIGILAKPAIFIPLQAGSRGDQVRNANFVKERGAALVCTNQSDWDKFAPKIIDLLSDNEGRELMATRWATLVHSCASSHIARLILEQGILGK